MKCEKIKLVEPTLELKEEFLAMAREFLAKEKPENGSLLDGSFEDFKGYVNKLKDHTQGLNLPNGWVPASTYWLVREDGTVLGYSSLRHQLTPTLEQRGGHIGYGIRPSERQKGYGTEILRMTLEKARQLPIERVMVACDDNNVGSAKIIEKCGGILCDKVVVENRQIPTRRYWIDLKNARSCDMKIRELLISDYDAVIELWQNCPGIRLHSDVDSKHWISIYLQRNPGLSFVAVQKG